MSRINQHLLGLAEQGLHVFTLDGAPEGVPMFTIERDVKLPRAARRATKPLSLPLSDMKEGESIFIPFAEYAPNRGDKARLISRIRTAIHRYQINHKGVSFSAHTMVDDDDQRGMRVFRIEGDIE